MSSWGSHIRPSSSKPLPEPMLTKSHFHSPAIMLYCITRPWWVKNYWSDLLVCCRNGVFKLIYNVYIYIWISYPWFVKKVLWYSTIVLLELLLTVHFSCLWFFLYRSFVHPFMVWCCHSSRLWTNSFQAMLLSRLINLIQGSSWYSLNKVGPASFVIKRTPDTCEVLSNL